MTISAGLWQVGSGAVRAVQDTPFFALQPIQ